MAAPATSARLLRPMQGRDPSEPGRVASSLELLTDLCFVVAVGQAALALEHGLVSGHPGTAVVGYAMGFFAIWWAWLNFTWFGSAYDNDDLGYRLLTIVQIVGVLILAAGVEPLTERHFGVAVVGYVVMRVALVGQWLRAARDDPRHRITCRRYAVGIVVVQLGWVAFSFASHVPALVLPLFVLLVLAELAVPVFAERAGETAWHPHHIAERYGLFFLIVLGETILSATLAVQTALVEHAEHRLAVLVLTLGGVLTVFSLWWLYFSREPGPVLARAQQGGSRLQYLFGFGHYFIFAAAAALGAGLAARTEYVVHPEEELALPTALGLTVPVAVLLVAMWGLHLRLHDPSWRAAVPFFTAAALVLAGTLTPAPEVVAGVVLALLAALETRLAGASAELQPG